MLINDIISCHLSHAAEEIFQVNVYFYHLSQYVATTLYIDPGNCIVIPCYLIATQLRIILLQAVLVRNFFRYAIKGLNFSS